MLPTKYYDEFSTENFSETFYIYSQQGLDFDAFKRGIEEGRLAVHVNRRYADLLIKDKTLLKLAPLSARLAYTLQHRLSSLLVLSALLMIVLSIIGWFVTGWWVGVALLFAAFLTTRYSMQAATRFMLEMTMKSRIFYETAGELSHYRLLMLGVRSANLSR